MRRKIGSLIALASLICGLAPTALAHPGHLGHGFGDGAAHPLLGIDHLLAMVAVGLLAARLGGRALWMLPAGFLGAMFVGGLLALAGVPLFGAEFAIAASVLVFGLLVAIRKTLPLAASLGIVMLFALFHGHAHVAEMAASGGFGLYAAGFLTSTAILLASGAAVATLIARGWTPAVVRACGAAISVASLAILLG